MPIPGELSKGLEPPKPTTVSLTTPSLAPSLPGPPLSSCVAKAQPGHSIFKGRRQSLLVAVYLSWELLLLGEPSGLPGQE